MIPLPARFRKIIYLVSAAVALALGGLQAFFAGSHLAQPAWLLGVVAVLAFLQIFISGLAASKTPTGNARSGAGVTAAPAAQPVGSGH